ncbi:MAG: branched-chain amino acid ABC transporter permease [Acidimicrobiia bacterium]
MAVTVAQKRAIGLTLVAAFVALLLAAPGFFLTSGYRLDVARLAIYVAILAATWSLLAGVAGQFSFAHVTIAGLSAYGGAIWVREVNGALGSVYGGIVFGTLFAWVVGTLLGLLLLRLRAAYLALFTIAFAEMVRLAVVAETDLTGGRLSLAVRPLPGSELTFHYLMVGLLMVLLGLIYWLLRSKYGLFLRAMREDEGAAAALAVNVVRLKVFVFSVTSLMLGFSAAVYTHTTTRLAPERLDLLFMGQVIAVAVIGGLESPLAAAIGALLMFGALENLRRISIGTGAFDVLTIVAVIVVVLLVAGLWRLHRKAGRPMPSAALRNLPWLGASTVLSVVFLFSIGNSSGLGGVGVWLVLAGAIAAAAAFVSRMYAAGLPTWFEPAIGMLVTISVGLALVLRMIPAASVDVELGVWRFGVFGALLMLTLRFARNGLIAPVIAYLSGRSEALALTVSKREAAGEPVAAPEDSS